MAHEVLTPRLRGVVGLTSLVAGAGLLVAALAGPAAAHADWLELARTPVPKLSLGRPRRRPFRRLNVTGCPRA